MYQAPFGLRFLAPAAPGSCSTVPRIAKKSVIGSQRVEICKRAADVAGDDAEERFGGRGEEADIEVGVEKKRRDVGAVQNVLQIVGGRALPLQRLLELAVESRQLLVQRLQLLLGGQQLLVGRLVFLIDGQRLFVDRFLLLDRNFEIADRALQLRSRGFEFLLEFGDPRNVSRRRRAMFFRLWPRARR